MSNSLNLFELIENFSSPIKLNHLRDTKIHQLSLFTLRLLESSLHTYYTPNAREPFGSYTSDFWRATRKARAHREPAY